MSSGLVKILSIAMALIVSIMIAYRLLPQAPVMNGQTAISENMDGCAMLDQLIQEQKQPFLDYMKHPGQSYGTPIQQAQRIEEFKKNAKKTDAFIKEINEGDLRINCKTQDPAFLQRNFKGIRSAWDGMHIGTATMVLKVR
jgi:hypothetical protein